MKQKIYKKESKIKITGMMNRMWEEKEVQTKLPHKRQAQQETNKMKDSRKNKKRTNEG
jgi:hypothetical protein